MAAPVEQKVTAATVAAVLTAAVLAGLNVVVSDTELMASLPGWVYTLLAAVTTAILTGLATYRAGWQAPHTPRPDLGPGQVPAAEIIDRLDDEYPDAR